MKVLVKGGQGRSSESVASGGVLTGWFFIGVGILILGFMF